MPYLKYISNEDSRSLQNDFVEQIYVQLGKAGTIKFSTTDQAPVLCSIIKGMSGYFLFKDQTNCRDMEVLLPDRTSALEVSCFKKIPKATRTMTIKVLDHQDVCYKFLFEIGDIQKRPAMSKFCVLCRGEFKENERCVVTEQGGIHEERCFAIYEKLQCKIPHRNRPR